MKKTTITTLLVATIALFTINMSAQNTMNPTEEALKNLKAYPEAIDSLERYVIYVGQQESETLFEVELIAGKELEVDCNNHRLLGSFVEETVQGWGFNYYAFETEGQIMSTMMMCPQAKTKKFVTGETTMIRYNSRLPIVVYLPKGYDLKYKVWSAGEIQTAEKK